ncbi:MAG: hypothetical protein QOA57_01315 [Nitrososphaeraceae archaeon]|nr:hypothetical protein [Nitrososphaeraceae archaeon]MDW3666773.1 hypothetical protein [Nitrososphaeraceae archaeon]
MNIAAKWSQLLGGIILVALSQLNSVVQNHKLQINFQFQIEPSY